MVQEPIISPLQEVRLSDGRSDGVHDPPRITGFLREDGAGVKRSLVEFWEDLPIEVAREGKLALPEDAKFNFLNKDITGGIGRRWKAVKSQFRQGLGVYDWVIKKQPDSVVVWTDAYPFTRAACMAANDLKKPSIELIHGNYHPYLHGHFEVSSYAKWKLGSWEYKKWAEFYGIDSTVIATGIPGMDIYAKADVGRLRTTARYELKIPESVPTICYLTDAVFSRSAWQDHGYSVGSFVEFAKTFKILQGIVGGVQLIVKVHPYEKGGLDRYEKALRDLGITEDYTIVDDPLILALSASDVTVGVRSSAMIAGLMLGIPAIVIEYKPFLEKWNYEKMGFVICDSPADILGYLIDILTEKEFMLELIRDTERGAKYFGGATDRMATHRAVRAIYQITTRGEVDDECWSENG